eukprot:980353_1
MGCCFGHDGQENDEVLQNLEAGSVVDVSEREEVDRSAAKSLQTFFRTHSMYIVSGVVALLIVAALVYGGYRHIRVPKVHRDMINLVSKMKRIKTASQLKNAFPGPNIRHPIALIAVPFEQALKGKRLPETVCQNLWDEFIAEFERLYNLPNVVREQMH